MTESQFHKQFSLFSEFRLKFQNVLNFDSTHKISTSFSIIIDNEDNKKNSGWARYQSLNKHLNTYSNYKRMKLKKKTWTYRVLFVTWQFLISFNFISDEFRWWICNFRAEWQFLCIKHVSYLRSYSMSFGFSSGPLHHILQHTSKPHLVSTNLQKFGGAVCQTKLPEHTQLQLITDGGPFAAVQGVRPLDLLRVPELLQPADHVLHHHQLGHWETKATENSCESLHFPSLI